MNTDKERIDTLTTRLDVAICNEDYELCTTLLQLINEFEYRIAYDNNRTTPQATE